MQNQNLELRRQERENLKTKYKNQRLQDAREIYLCECQKVYLSFPALYLHVKNKHKIKLTTKITDKICKMEQKDGKTYITYFLINESQQQKGTENSNQSEGPKKSFINSGIRTSNSQNDQKTYLRTQNYLADSREHWEGNLNDIPNSWIKSIIEQFLREMAYPTVQSCQLFYRTLAHFLNYIEICSENSKQFERLKIYHPQTMVGCLPMYFNQFLCFYLPRYGGSSMQQSDLKITQIEVIKCFGTWLNQKRLTTYLALYGI